MPCVAGDGNRVRRSEERNGEECEQKKPSAAISRIVISELARNPCPDPASTKTTRDQPSGFYQLHQRAGQKTLFINSLCQRSTTETNWEMFLTH